MSNVSLHIAAGIFLSQNVNFLDVKKIIIGNVPILIDYAISMRTINIHTIITMMSMILINIV